MPTNSNSATILRGCQACPGVEKERCCLLMHRISPSGFVATRSQGVRAAVPQKMVPLIEFHHSQFGSGPHCGVVFPQVCVQHIAAYAREHICSSATLFVDVVQAFDAVALPIIWGTTSSGPVAQRDLQQKGYHEDKAVKLLEFLQCHPGIMDKLGVPRVVIDLLRAWGSYTWMITGDSSERAVHPHTGVPQGHNLSALLFDLFYSDLMIELDKELSDHDLCVNLLVPVGRTPVTSEECDACAVCSVTYRDDLGIPIMDADCDVLLAKVAKVTEIVEAIHRKRFLQVNYSKGKTECTLNLTGRRSAGLLQGLKQVGKAKNMPCPVLLLSIGQSLQVVADYPHLGRIHSQTGCCTKEINAKLGQAGTAFKRRRKVLTSTLFTTQARLSLYQVYIACHLLKNVPVHAKLPEKDYHKLRSCYFAQIRKVVHESTNSFRASALTDDDICVKYKVANFLTLVDRRRLQALP
eukprot:4839036-Amphidinium_carterae.2